MRRRIDATRTPATPPPPTRCASTRDAPFWPELTLAEAAALTELFRALDPGAAAAFVYQICDFHDPRLAGFTELDVGASASGSTLSPLLCRIVPATRGMEGLLRRVWPVVPGVLPVAPGGLHDVTAHYRFQLDGTAAEARSRWRRPARTACPPRLWCSGPPMARYRPFPVPSRTMD
ncbi:MAG TPA: hypothetical protein VGA70_07105 [Longimicrobiales bacterium]